MWVTNKVNLAYNVDCNLYNLFIYFPPTVMETGIIYLSIDHFSFDPFVYTLTRKPKTKPTWKIDDISKGQEPMPISVSKLDYGTHSGGGGKQQQQNRWF